MYIPSSRYVGYTINAMGFYFGLSTGYVPPMAIMLIVAWSALGLLVIVPLAVIEIVRHQKYVDGTVGLLTAVSNGIMCVLGVIYSITFVIIKAGN